MDAADLSTNIHIGGSIFYVSMVIFQFGALLATRNRRVSLFQSSPLWGPRRNWWILFGCVCTVGVSLINLYSSRIQSEFGSAPIPTKVTCCFVCCSRRVPVRLPFTDLSHPQLLSNSTGSSPSPSPPLSLPGTKSAVLRFSPNFNCIADEHAQRKTGAPEPFLGGGDVHTFAGPCARMHPVIVMADVLGSKEIKRRK
ncbi:hypothetical protein BDK51DRAFT_41399 [Blyttiomyces helicus]|uniref:Uncharacterized protein n=1 Tax=Blyttiomyces helicus TaxID=388810 RepID=A0A4P9WJM2_9FUNG|nr:hypothetical protein BDK51DRAFT_41399 [Blyttiomyces helicus]|eukprot:RKO93131.1 hypothetical protein BDK51DRAFT_41399 [Blyttiomyces helicus]